MELAHSFARDQLQKAGMRQKRNYGLRARWGDFKAGDLVWVHSPRRKKGRCPKLDSHCVGPCEVLEKLGEVVYRVQLPPKGRRVALHRDRLAPYRGDARPHQRPGPYAISQRNQTTKPLDSLTVSPIDSTHPLPTSNSTPALQQGVPRLQAQPLMFTPKQPCSNVLL